MIDVEIRNFQSIEHVKVQIDGFTTLVGRSNLGKSAFVRALKAALTGAPEEAYIRHGPTCERTVKGTKSCKCFCSVHIKSEGFDLLWEKGGDRNEYVINGEKKTAVGKGTPEFLEAGFGLVRIGERKVLLQVADQFRHEGGGPIFLLDESGAVVADVLSDVAQLDRINVAARMAEKDRKEAASQRKLREKDVLELKIRLTGFDGLDTALGQVKTAETEEGRITAQRAKRDQLGEFRAAVMAVARRVKALLEAPKIVIPEPGPFASQQKKATALGGYIAETSTRQAVIDKLSGVDLVTVPAIEPVREHWTRFSKAHAWLAKLRTLRDLFARWKGVEAAITPDIAGLLVTAGSTIKLNGLRSRYAALESQVSKLEEQLAASEAEFQAVEIEKGELGVCPTCTQPISLPHEHAAE